MLDATAQGRVPAQAVLVKPVVCLPVFLSVVTCLSITRRSTALSTVVRLLWLSFPFACPGAALDTHFHSVRSVRYSAFFCPPLSHGIAE